MAARPQFSNEQRAFVVLQYAKYKPSGYKIFVRISQDFEKKFPGERIPSKKAMQKMVEKFGTKFTVGNCCSEASPGDSHSGAKRTVRTPQNIEAVRRAVTADQSKDVFDPTVVSGHRNGLGLSKSTFGRIVKEDLRLHCYKLSRRFEMKEGDKARRLAFAQKVCALTDQQLANIAFSDEAYFNLDGEVNTQNIRRYAPLGEKPESFIHTTNKYPQKVMCFLGLHSSGKLLNFISVYFMSPTSIFRQNVFSEILQDWRVHER